MIYYVELGRNVELSMEELTSMFGSEVTRKGQLVFFDSQTYEGDLGKDFFSKLAGITKWGAVLDETNLDEVLKDVKIVGVDSNELGLMIKRNSSVRRYKVLEPGRSDLEIKKKGKEISSLGEGKYGVVMARQDVTFFETVDFGKPARGMDVGMMPAKLTQLLVNIGAAIVQKTPEDTLTIYDPFCGFGTTNFIANALGYHTIGSDINITPYKQNQKWWERTEYFKEQGHMTHFKHDVLQPFDKPFLDYVDVIVTEGRLGPVVKSEMLKHKAQTYTILKDHIQKIVDVYTGFLANIHARIPHIPIVMTIPEYLRLDHPIIQDRITQIAQDIGYTVKPLGEVYKRKTQNVGRRVLKLSVVH